MCECVCVTVCTLHLPSVGRIRISLLRNACFLSVRFIKLIFNFTLFYSMFKVNKGGKHCRILWEGSRSRMEKLTQSEASRFVILNKYLSGWYNKEHCGRGKWLLWGENKMHTGFSLGKLRERGH